MEKKTCALCGQESYPTAVIQAGTGMARVCSSCFSKEHFGKEPKRLSICAECGKDFLAWRKSSNLCRTCYDSLSTPQNREMNYERLLTDFVNYLTIEGLFRHKDGEHDLIDVQQYNKALELIPSFLSRKKLLEEVAQLERSES